MRFILLPCIIVFGLGVRPASAALGDRPENCSLASRLAAALGTGRQLKEISSGFSLAPYEVQNKPSLQRKLEAGEGLLSGAGPNAHRNILNTYARWGHELGARPGHVYRGMALSPQDIESIRRYGMSRDEVSFLFDGIHVAKQIEVTIPYALALRRDNPKKKIGAIFEIDLDRIDPSILNRSNFKFKNDIPPGALTRTLIFDPSGELSGLPFVELTSGK